MLRRSCRKFIHNFRLRDDAQRRDPGFKRTLYLPARYRSQMVAKAKPVTKANAVYMTEFAPDRGVEVLYVGLLAL